jgi:hypothetical protein
MRGKENSRSQTGVVPPPKEATRELPYTVF